MDIRKQRQSTAFTAQNHCSPKLYSTKASNVHHLAGLLTYSVSEILPIKKQWIYYSKTLVWSLQQRVCPGFSPDSLLSAFYGSPDSGKDKQLLTHSKHEITK
ncbi:hypothetical protein J2Y40_003723 [Chryseobacterium sp. 2987]|nr:hypothetical protein [Chryseobacterium sp. 2987]